MIFCTEMHVHLDDTLKPKGKDGYAVRAILPRPNGGDCCAPDHLKLLDKSPNIHYNIKINISNNGYLQSEV
jgi:hypothetical protein